MPGTLSFQTDKAMWNYVYEQIRTLGLDKFCLESSSLQSNKKEPVQQVDTNSESSTQSAPSILSDSILVFNKVDLLESNDEMPGFVVHRNDGFSRIPVCYISCTTNQGMDVFVQTLKEKVEKL